MLVTKHPSGVGWVNFHDLSCKLLPAYGVNCSSLVPLWYLTLPQCVNLLSILSTLTEATDLTEILHLFPCF